MAREAKSLIQAGHRVYLLCLGNPGQPPTECLDGLHVHRIFPQQRRDALGPLAWTIEAYNPHQLTAPEAYLYRLRLALGPVKLGLKLPVWPKRQCVTDMPQRLFWQNQFLPPFWVNAIDAFTRDYPIEALHLHDLPMVYPGLVVAGAKGLPVVADLHENWPALMAINRNKRKTLLQRWLGHDTRWEALESLCVEQADQVIVVADSAKVRLEQKGVSSQKISVVSNTIDSAAFLANPLDEAFCRQFDDRFVVSYIGGFGPHRGIDTLLRAAARLKSRIPNLLLFLAGSDGPNSEAYLNTCRQLAAELGVADITHFTGWAADKDYRTYTALSDVGIIPHKANPHTQTTMPNKLYHYMLLGKPVICSNLAPLEPVLQETDAGLCFPSDDDAQLAEQIARLYHDPALREQMGQNGVRWVSQKYNWTVSAHQLTVVYQALAHAGS